MEKIKSCEVAIIGGGLAGLTAAYLLSEAGADLQLFESSGHLGGRIDSVRDVNTGQAIADLGPTWVWPPYQASVTNWLNRLNLDIFPQYETGNAVLDLDQKQPPRHQFLPGQHGIARIVRGPQSIVDALIAGQPSSIHNLDCTLTSIEEKGDRFLLRFSDPPKPAVSAAAVIVAAPLRLMAQNVSWNGLLNDTILDVMENTPTWMSTQTKASVIYKRPFWREHGLSGRVASGVGPLTEIHDHTSFDEKFAALFGFVDLSIRHRQSETLKQDIVEQLIRCFGAEAANFEQLEIKDWARDKNICSDRDLQTVAGHPKILSPNIRKSFCQNKLAFAVAETAVQHPGLIDGAIETGERAARLLLEARV